MCVCVCFCNCSRVHPHPSPRNKTGGNPPGARAGGHGESSRPHEQDAASQGVGRRRGSGRGGEESAETVPPHAALAGTWVCRPCLGCCRGCFLWGGGGCLDGRNTPLHRHPHTFPHPANQPHTNTPNHFKPTQIWILNRRHFAKISKDKRALFLNHTNFLVLSIFWGTLYSYSGARFGVVNVLCLYAFVHMCHSTHTSTSPPTHPHTNTGGAIDPQTHLSVLYSSVCIASFSQQNVMPALFQLRPLFYRERGVYGTAFLFVSSIVDL